jgi:hypothetical protein
MIVRHIFEHYHHSYCWNIREARKNLQYLYREPVEKLRAFD